MPGHVKYYAVTIASNFFLVMVFRMDEIAPLGAIFFLLNTFKAISTTLWILVGRMLHERRRFSLSWDERDVSVEEQRTTLCKYLPGSCDGTIGFSG